MRTKRTNGSTTYNYVYNGGSLVKMTVGSNTLHFAYEASGKPLAVIYNGTRYHYVTNLQGDVVQICQGTTPVVNYTYDAWGKLLTISGDLASTLGTHNPLRYRGYVYDTETQLYYLQSRYYSPVMGRFINADVLVATGQGLLGNNVFAYCANNPVNRIDYTGTVGLTFPTIEDYYGMHKAVQYDIAEERGYGIEVPVISLRGTGRLDLYDGVTHTYYEVKHITATDGKAFEDQMKKYDSSYVTGWRFAEYQIFGKVSRGREVFSGSTEYLYWDISYKSTGDGLVIYTWEFNARRYQQFITTMVVAATATVSGYMYGGAAQGVERISIRW